VLASRSFTFESGLAPNDILARLAPRVRSVSPRYAWTLASLDARLEPSGSLDLFIGGLTDSGFRIARASWHALRPVISGSLMAAASHTVVTVRVGYDLPSKLFVALLTLLPIICALLLVQGFPPFPLIPVAVFLAGGILLVSHLVVVYAAQRFRGTLQHLLGSPEGVPNNALQRTRYARR
jgi:hypothetical protein